MKLFEKWKQEWWLKHASHIALEYQSKVDDLTKRLEKEIAEQTYKNKLIFQNLKLEEEELNHRLQTIKDRILEAKQKDNELREQIRLLEAKASPSSVWCEAFTQGINKAWDMMLPVFEDNLEEMRKHLYDKAVLDTLGRIHGNNKKTN